MKIPRWQLQGFKWLQQSGKQLLENVMSLSTEEQQQQGTTNNVMSLSAAAPYSYPFGPRSAIEELHELCKPFFTKSLPQQQQSLLQASSPPSSFSVAAPPPPLKPVQPQEKQHQQQRSNTNKHPRSGGDSVTTPRSKTRKNQLKRVCQVPVENLSSDISKDRDPPEGPIPHLEARLSMLLSIVPLAIANVLNDHPEHHLSSVQVPLESGYGHEMKSDGSRKLGLISSIQVLGHFSSLLCPPTLVMK